MLGSDPRTDDELVKAANRGDGSAFETLYRRHRDWVTRLARRFTGNAEDALDVLQQTFAYLLTRLPGLRLSGRLTTFLYPVVRSLSFTLLRKHGRWVSGSAAAHGVAAPADSGGADRAELAAVMSGLPETHREVILMRFVDDMSLEEIAMALEIPLGTVKSRLHNAIRMLRDDPRTRRYFGID